MRSTLIGVDVPEVTMVEAPKLQGGELARGAAPAMGTSLARGAVPALSASGMAVPEWACDLGADMVRFHGRARAQRLRNLGCETAATDNRN